MGRSGLLVSKLCLGTMAFGNSCDEKEAHRIMDAALDAGINFFDSADNTARPPITRASPRRSSAAGSSRAAAAVSAWC